MLRVFLLYLFTFLVFWIMSCKKNRGEQLLDEWIGKQIVLPEKGLIQNKGYKYIPNGKAIKVMIIINGDCSVCIEELKWWKKFMRKIDTSRVGFIFSIQSYDNLTAFKAMDSLEINLNYPYYHDKEKEYTIKNGFPEEKLYQTFLLNNNNEIVIVGNPKMSKGLSNLYLKKINELINKNSK